MLVNEKTAAQFLGTTAATLRVQRCVGPRPNGAKPIPFIRIGRAIRYDEKDLQAYVDAHRVNPEVQG